MGIAHSTPGTAAVVIYYNRHNHLFSWLVSVLLSQLAKNCLKIQVRLDVAKSQVSIAEEIPTSWWHVSLPCLTAKHLNVHLRSIKDSWHLWYLWPLTIDLGMDRNTILTKSYHTMSIKKASNHWKKMRNDECWWQRNEAVSFSAASSIPGAVTNWFTCFRKTSICRKRFICWNRSFLCKNITVSMEVLSGRFPKPRVTY